jgi:hypothetical protein
MYLVGFNWIFFAFLWRGAVAEGADVLPSDPEVPG